MPVAIFGREFPAAQQRSWFERFFALISALGLKFHGECLCFRLKVKPSLRNARRWFDLMSSSMEVIFLRCWSLTSPTSHVSMNFRFACRWKSENWVNRRLPELAHCLQSELWSRTMPRPEHGKSLHSRMSLARRQINGTFSIILCCFWTSFNFCLIGSESRAFPLQTCHFLIDKRLQPLPRADGLGIVATSAAIAVYKHEWRRTSRYRR